ncbi:MAG: HPF/RaiA family ribosome-associated protein [Kofleriaceae bacterium]
MTTPLRVTFRDMDRSAALESFARAWYDKLEHVSTGIDHCDVVFERPHQHQHSNQPFHVRVSLASGEILVSVDATHVGAYVAIRDAFRAARRQLQDQIRRQRRDVKQHSLPH